MKGEDSYRKYLNGDDSGLVELITEYRDGLLLYISGITGNITSAEDIIEEVFFRLAAKKPKFGGRCSFKTWLYAIGRNAAMDMLRKSRKISDKPIEDYADLKDTQSIEQEYLKEERKIQVHKALASLSADYRQALILSYFEGFDNAEAARIMGKSKRQIENLLYRAKAALRKELEKGGFVYEEL